MKVAVVTDDGKTFSQHFGRARYYQVYEIKDGLNKGERITITGFGTFSLAKRKAREFVNPKTKEVYQIPEKQTPFFKAGSNFFKKVL